MAKSLLAQCNVLGISEVRALQLTAGNKTVIIERKLKNEILNDNIVYGIEDEYCLNPRNKINQQRLKTKVQVRIKRGK